ncbi:RtcB family protein, partial [Pyxidicoccus sp. 3LG]
MMPRILADAPGSVPILVWARALPPGAEKQLRHIATQPYVVEHVAAMPDVHVSSGVAVGTVFATTHHVVPGAL